MDKSSGNRITNKSFSRNNWKYYLIDSGGKPTISTKLVDRLNISHQITFEGGSVSDDDKTFLTAKVVSDAGGTITIGSESGAFQANDGLIQIGDELILYESRVPNGSNWNLYNCHRGYAHTIELSGGHAADADVSDMSDTAIDKKYKIETLDIRGGTIYIWWRNHRYEGLITKMTWTDSKTGHTGGLSRPTRFNLTITFRIGLMPS